MFARIRHSYTLRGAFAVLGVMVLAMHMLVPSGFMPVQTKEGMVVTLCTGNGPVEVILDTGDHQSKGDGKQAANDHCVFAAAPIATPDTPFDADALLPTWQRSNGPVAVALHNGFIARLAAPPPPSSGPPVTA